MQNRQKTDKEEEEAGGEAIGEALFPVPVPPSWHTHGTQISFINSNVPS